MEETSVRDWFIHDNIILYWPFHPRLNLSEEVALPFTKDASFGNAVLLKNSKEVPVYSELLTISTVQ